MGYRRLALGDRYQIQALFQNGESIRGIATILGRSASTISREISRNRTKTTYFAQKAQRLTHFRRQSIGPKRKIAGGLEREVKKLIRKDWSPEQIVGRLRRGRRRCVCHETIYQYIYREKRAGGGLYLHLRRKRKRRWPREEIKRIQAGNSAIPGRIMIEDRPRIVDRRKRYGDIERDLIVDRKRAALLTLVDRATRRVIIRPVEKIDAKLVHKATVVALKSHKIKTITNDNGTEFARFKETEKTLGVPIYFTNPFSSWEKGTNENTNGLIRRYLPKGTPLGGITMSEAKKIQRKLNNRPRKCLGYRTPNEVYNQMTGCCVKT